MKKGQILSDTYDIELKLDAGGGGTVYKAWHKRLRKYVAIKELKHTQFISEESRRNEVEALKNLKNAHLPQILDFLSEQEQSYTVMEFVEGVSFNKLLKGQNDFSQYRVIEWYGQLASALVELHSHEICHGDIKPANVMLMPNGNVCLIDFNVAVVKGNDTRLISRSQGYASPEQCNLFEQYKNRDIQNYSNIDWKLSDIYSLGATMHHILTGKRLKNDKKAQSSPCFFIIERSTHLNPNNRFASAKALSATIQSLLSV